MPTETLSAGPLWTMPQNVVFALPPTKVRLFTNTAAAAFEQSNDPTFATLVAVVLTNGMADLAGGFIRSTAGAALVILKRD